MYVGFGDRMEHTRTEWYGDGWQVWMLCVSKVHMADHGHSTPRYIALDTWTTSDQSGSGAAREGISALSLTPCPCLSQCCDLWPQRAQNGTVDLFIKPFSTYIKATLPPLSLCPLSVWAPGLWAYTLRCYVWTASDRLVLHLTL